MKYFFLLFLTLNNFVFYAMDLEDNKPKITLRKKINEIKNKSHKWKFECQQCKRKVFDLSRHNRMHTGERPYRCSMCPKTFTESGPCVNHIREDHPEAKSIVYTVHFLGKAPYTRFAKAKIQTQTLVEESSDAELLNMLNQENLISDFLAEQKSLALINNQSDI
jgi:hypothetical protein